MSLAAILSLSGPKLTADERALFRAAAPAGYILFGRNVTSPEQVRALTDELLALHGRLMPVLIDQEGGRVARLRPPHWPKFPAAARFAELFVSAPLSALEAARLNGLALAATLRALGITVDCLPVLDVPQPGAHEIIGDRAYGAEPSRIAALGGATLDGLQAGGVVGVVKHIPGHGRARVDSHLELPVVEASAAELETDLAPFAALAGRARMAMTAHVTYTAWDARRCATVSPTVIADVIRGRIGFDGWLMSDDLGMKALAGTAAENGLAALAAGCDVALHCNGDFAEMAALAEALPRQTAEAGRRLAAAMELTAAPDPGTAAELAAKRDALLALA
ncbi:MAG: beta-N-acetylhexosaminidase [Sphingomonadaceae bacterium]|nr:beta-N-acetylhexosaminidase [Sphingomonadaceae bacterium]